MTEKKSRSEFSYSTENQSKDLAASHLALEAIAEYPQVIGCAECLIAYRLLEKLNQPHSLSLLDAYEANIDPDTAWEETNKWHMAYGVGTNKPQFRNPANPESAAVYPKDPQWLANFTKSFVVRAVGIIQDQVAAEQGKETRPSLPDTEQALKDQKFLKRILERIRPEYEQFVREAREHRKKNQQWSHEKHGVVRDDYKDH